VSHRSTRNTLRSASALGVCALACALAISGLSGCRGDRSAERPRQFFPDMDDQPKYTNQGDNPAFDDNRAMRPPVAGVVAFATSTDPDDPERRWMFIDNDAVARGVTPDGSYVQRMPLRQILGVADGERIAPRQVEDFINLGRERYAIFCYPCHGAVGDGKGIVGNLWSAPLPSYHEPRYQPGGELGQDGRIFHTIRNGVANTPGAQPALRMPAYGERITVEQSWAIVAYIRALQKTQKGELRDVPESIADGLLARRGAATSTEQTTNDSQEPAP